ncbi:MAG: YbaK/EbsC family protein [Chloroflexota bacterium]
MRESVRRVHNALVAGGVEPHIVEFAESTRTAEEAAAAIGTTVGAIVKSLLFLADGQPIMALVSGDNRVDVNALGALAGGSISRCPADLVRGHTGFAIGGVPPIGLATAVPIYLDEDLFRFDTVWAAAGTPHTVFAISPHTLATLTGATPATLKQR